VNNLEEKIIELQVQLKEKTEGMSLISKNIGETMSQVNELIRMKASQHRSSEESGVPSEERKRPS
jgi:hypothetical protein